MKVVPSPYSFARHRKLVFTVHNALRRTSKPASKTDADNQAVYGVSMGFVSDCISRLIRVSKLSPKKRKIVLGDNFNSPKDNFYFPIRKFSYTYRV